MADLMQLTLGSCSPWTAVNLVQSLPSPFDPLWGDFSSHLPQYPLVSYTDLLVGDPPLKDLSASGYRIEGDAVLDLILPMLTQISPSPFDRILPRPKIVD